jgi:hypothetical protein
VLIRVHLWLMFFALRSSSWLRAFAVNIAGVLTC